jgi:hypothetical protein
LQFDPVAALRQPTEERLDLRAADRYRMALVVKENELPIPLDKTANGLGSVAARVKRQV